MTNYKVITSAISDSLAAEYENFENEFGFGPCGAYAALKREQGWGQVAICIARAGNTEFPHYIIVDDDSIIDLANPLGEPLTYTDIDILDTNEMPELCQDREAVDWLETRRV